MLTIALRTVLIYLFLLLGMRMMGKRQIGQLQLSELVTMLLLSELATAPILDPSIPLLRTLVPLSILLALEVVLPVLTAHFPLLKRAVDGVPSILICRGRIDWQELSRIRLSPDELLAELRLQGVGDLSDVDYAILEQSGRLSVILKGEKQPLTPEDLGKDCLRPGIDHPLVLLGKVSRFHLRLLQKDSKWLKEHLRKKGTTLKDVLLFTVNDRGEETLITKNGESTAEKTKEREELQP